MSAFMYKNVLQLNKISLVVRLREKTRNFSVVFKSKRSICVPIYGKDCSQSQVIKKLTFKNYFKKENFI